MLMVDVMRETKFGAFTAFNEKKKSVFDLLLESRFQLLCGHKTCSSKSESSFMKCLQKIIIFFNVFFVLTDILNHS